ncbi:hypothetical protein ACEWY4_010389 [Coilia grayii]|uniref:SBF1/SBF2 domain-containing protein n=1 Tax=Coilia grayii TaxID=363190 RepID=A0ABD1K1S6_9TELE
MEGVAVGNLIDFDLPSSMEAAAPPVVLNGTLHLQQPDIFATQGLLPSPMLPSPLAPSMPPPAHDGDGEGGESDATESADSENDMGNESPSHRSQASRRSSSSSTQSAEGEELTEKREFIKAYVEKVFHGREDFDQEEKARFGGLCSGESGSKGREWFARYVSAQRCNSKCVSEQTFYRLVQSFAVVLYECHQMDEYGPAKNLMTMCFTYYHMGKSQLSPTELLDRPTSGIDSYLRSANTWLSGKKDMAERLLKNTSTRPDVKGFFGGLESKLRGPSARNNEEPDSPGEGKPKSPVSPEPPGEKKVEKVYLYTQLKQQPIWHTLRFWNAAFFDAVHCERRKMSPTTTREKWCHMTQEERDDTSRLNENITFGQLGTFTHNMLAFGLSKKLCNDFLKKQAVIGNLNEEQYKLLSDHIEQMAQE